MVGIIPKPPRSRCGTLFYVMNGFFLGSLLIYLAKTLNLSASPISSSSIVSKCSTGPSTAVRGSQYPNTNDARNMIDPENMNYSYSVNFEHSVQTCLDPDGPLPVIVMSLGRSGTDSTWQILKHLTNTEMKAIEIVGGNEEGTVDFFRALEGMPNEIDSWALDETYDWRKRGGGVKAATGFYFHIKDFCENGNCIDGKWIFKWFCDEQQRHKEIGGLVGFKWKAYMSALRTQPAYNALKLIANLGVTNTPIRVVRSRRNPLDVYLSELKHSLQDDLPDHCKADDEECIKKHASVKLVVPVDEMFEWVHKTFEEENEIDALLSSLGVRTVHIDYDQLYYAPSEVEGAKEWNRIFKFLNQPHNWSWVDIQEAAGLKPTTKSRSHRVLIENFQQVYNRLRGTRLEQFVRDED